MSESSKRKVDPQRNRADLFDETGNPLYLWQMLLHRKPGLPAVITVAWLLVPFVAMVVVSYALVPIFGFRYTSHLAAPAALMIGYTLATLPSRALTASLLVALAVWQVTGVVRVHALYSRDQWREAAVWVGSREEPGDLILQVGFSPLN